MDQAPLKAALVVLSRQAPRAIAFETLTERVAELLGAGQLDGETRTRLSRNLLGLYKKGAIDLWASEKPISPRPTSCPTAFVFARHQARLGSSFCTSLLHEAVQVDSFDRALIKRMDGTLDGAALTAAVLEDARAGIVSVEMNGGPCLEREVFDEITERKLLMFGKRGFLVG